MTKIQQSMGEDMAKATSPTSREQAAASKLQDEQARALFDAMPSKHPSGLIPDWDIQPEHIKDVFRRWADDISEG